ncbi:MAG: imidazole glycerol phosphate synthase subunit HisH [Gemmatimonadaceae bacterium]
MRRPLRVTIFDYGAGNLHSLAKALEAAGVAVRAETDPARAVAGADALVLPGVGAFSQAAGRLAPARERVRDALAGGLPCLGICLGMQLLFSESQEGPGAGLGVVPGAVTRLRARRVPQIGWNQLEGVAAGEPLFRRAPLDVVYFANSYVCRLAPGAAGAALAWATHEGDRFVAAVRAGNTVGVQFHPEKSSTAGVAFVRAWVEEACDLGGPPHREGSAAAERAGTGFARPESPVPRPAPRSEAP